MPTGIPAPGWWPGSRTTSTGTRLAPERRARRRPGEVLDRPADVEAPPHAPAVGGRPAGRPDADLADRDASADEDILLEIDDDQGATLFEAAIAAYHAGDYLRAESLFLEEASRALDEAPQRAAIAYRQAALSARLAGNADGSDHWMRLAGREYLRVSEDVRTPLPFIREAAIMAAKCFLSVENLQVAGKGLRRARAIESVLQADDDLMATSTEIPFHHGTPVAADRPPGPGPGRPTGPVGGSGPADPGADGAAAPRRGLRRLLARHSAA